MRTTTRYTDWGLLLEIALLFTLFVLGVVYYWRPVAIGELEPRWWHGALMTLIFFVAVGAAYRRRRIRGRAELRAALNETRDELAGKERERGEQAADQE